MQSTNCSPVTQALVIVVVINCIEHGFPYLGKSGGFQIVGGTTFSALHACPCSCCTVSHLI